MHKKSLDSKVTLKIQEKNLLGEYTKKVKVNGYVMANNAHEFYLMVDGQFLNDPVNRETLESVYATFVNPDDFGGWGK